MHIGNFIIYSKPFAANRLCQLRFRTNRKERATDKKPPKKGRTRSSAKKQQPDTVGIVNAILKHHHFARNHGDRLFVYQHGAYRKNGKRFLQQAVIDYLRKWEVKWTSYQGDEVFKYISLKAPDLWEKPPRDVINVQNGLLNVITEKLLPHNPKHLSPIQLPISYDPKARCPHIDEFIARVFPDDTETIAWEIFAWLMTPDTSIQKAILFLGNGANGKSTFISLLNKFLGRRNTSSMSLQKLEDDRFAVAGLYGKLANLCPDLPETKLNSTMMFKAITGGDPITAEHKYGELFEFEPYARLLFSSNKPPQSDDATDGFFRRWLVVPFERTFKPGEPGTMRREDLDAMLSSTEELSGALNKTLLALKKIRQDSFTESEKMRDAFNQFRRITDPFAVWAESEIEVTGDPYDLAAIWVVRSRFNAYLREQGKAQYTNMAFAAAFKRTYPNVPIAKRTWLPERKEDCYVGIRLKSEAHLSNQSESVPKQ